MLEFGQRSDAGTGQSDRYNADFRIVTSPLPKALILPRGDCARVTHFHGKYTFFEWILSRMSDESRVPASCGFCAICFDSIAPEDETFIDPCFHHFCYKVRNWRLYTFLKVAERWLLQSKCESEMLTEDRFCCSASRGGPRPTPETRTCAAPSVDNPLRPSSPTAMGRPLGKCILNLAFAF